MPCATFKFDEILKKLDMVTVQVNLKLIMALKATYLLMTLEILLTSH